MHQEKVKLIIKNVELLLQELKKELDLEERFVYPKPMYDDYDEIFED